MMTQREREEAVQRAAEAAAEANRKLANALKTLHEPLPPKTKKVLLVDGPDAGKIIELPENTRDYLVLQPVDPPGPYNYSMGMKTVRYVFSRLSLFGHSVEVGHCTFSYEKRAEEILLSHTAQQMIGGYE